MLDYVLIELEELFGLRELRLSGVIVAMVDLSGREDIVVHFFHAALGIAG